ncbi:MAG: hypothetical protein CL764_01595 [Chloroflexi bacterium]|nr:hypothetical protein [Chloroflexota bacterium]|tara:strand:- start:2712 stop:3233 length:522 start_codon:yes stop_codon:yes gene_type:complete
MKKYLTDFFSFPNPVNEVSARLVALGVFFICIFSLILMLLDLPNLYPIIILSLLTYGFLARVSSGPKISPLALLVTKIIVPNINIKEKLVAGPPKRFAQLIGLIFSGLALILFIFSLKEVSMILISILIIFTFLESFLGFCAGCKVFNILIKLGLIPQTICEACSNYTPKNTT